MPRRPNTGRPTIEHVAHHEAGHFVAAYFHAMHESVYAVTIVPSGDAAGVNRGEYPLGEGCSVGEIERVIIQLFAGYAAEVQFDPSCSGRARTTADDDDEKAQTFLRWFCKKKPARDERERELRAEARALVVEHWTAVAALAQGLLERKTVDRWETTWIVAIAEGEQAKRELAGRRAAQAIMDAHRVATNSPAEKAHGRRGRLRA